MTLLNREHRSDPEKPLIIYVCSYFENVAMRLEQFLAFSKVTVSIGPSR